MQNLYRKATAVALKFDQPNAGCIMAQQLAYYMILLFILNQGLA